MRYEVVTRSRKGFELCRKHDGRALVYASLSNAKTVDFNAPVNFRQATKAVSRKGDILCLRVPIAHEGDVDFLVKDGVDNRDAPASNIEVAIAAWLLDHGVSRRHLKNCGLVYEDVNFDESDDPHISLCLSIVVPVEGTLEAARDGLDPVG